MDSAAEAISTVWAKPKVVFSLKLNVRLGTIIFRKLSKWNDTQSRTKCVTVKNKTTESAFLKMYYFCSNNHHHNHHHQTRRCKHRFLFRCYFVISYFRHRRKESRFPPLSLPYTFVEIAAVHKMHFPGRKYWLNRWWCVFYATLHNIFPHKPNNQ